MGPPAPPALTCAHEPLYIIVATTLPHLGIGLRGALPWPQLKKDMAFFRRVTTRLPEASPTKGDGAGGEGGQRMNAVIMGRRTWESIPKKYRPLGGRWNVVLSTSMQPQADEDVLVCGNLSTALRRLDDMGERVGRKFLIGGAGVYGRALELAGKRRVSSAGQEVDSGAEGPGVNVRVIQTQVKRRDGREVECDTFFPEGLGRAKQVTDQVLAEWVGEQAVQVSAGKQAMAGNGGEKGDLVKDEATGQEWVADGAGEYLIRMEGWELDGGRG